MTERSKLLSELKPTIIGWINSQARAGNATNAIDRSQAPWVATDIATAIDAHESDVDPHSRYVHVSVARTITAPHTFSTPQTIKAISLTGSIEPWTTAAWGKPLEMPGPGQAVVWPKGGTAYSWGIGASGGNLYFGHSTADDNSAAVTYDLVLDGTFLRSSNYASRVSGWSIDSLNGAADFQYLFTKQLHAEIFVADVTRALAGIEVVTKSVTLLGDDFIVPYPGTTATLRVKDLPSAAGMQVFEPGDYVNPPTFDRSGGALTIGDCWGTVSSPVDNGDGTQRWTFTRTGTVTYKTISQRGTVVGTSSSSTATVSLAKPTGTTTNDFVLVQINYVGTHTLSSPVSYPFTRLIQRSGGGNTMEIWYRLAGSSEPSTYDFTFEANVNCGANITAWQNVGTASIYIDNSLSQVNASSTSMTVAPGLTPRSAAGMLLYYGMAVGNIRATPPSGMTELADAGTGSAQHYLASQLLSSASATGTKTATLASAAANVAALVLLMPGYTSMSTQAGAALPLTTIQAVDGNEGAVLDYGVAGNGYVEINAIDGARGINSPYIRVVTFSGHPADSKTVRTQMGNLRGLFGVTGEYGFYGGDGTAVTDKYFRLSSYTQEIHNLPIKMYNGSTLFMQMDTSGLRYNVAAATATFADNTSVFFYESNGTTKLLQLVAASDVSGGHGGMLKLHPGTSNSDFTISAESDSSHTAYISLNAHRGSSDAAWQFNNLYTGSIFAEFPGYLQIDGDAVSITNHYGQIMIDPTGSDSDAFISIRTTRSTDRTWLIGAGSGAPNTNFRIYDYTASAERFTIDSSGVVGIASATPTISDGIGLDITGKILRLRTSKTPASAAATGNAGEICWDSSFIYVCTATNTWKRAATATW